MSKMRSELISKIKEANKEYTRIESLLAPYGFSVCTRSVFYGERPFSLYCGEIEDYQAIIEDIDNIKEMYLKYKMESSGIISKNIELVKTLGIVNPIQLELF